VETTGAPAAMRDAFRTLLAAYGPQGWWPAETDEEVVVGAVLTQAVSWSNVERALARLRQAGLLSLAALADADAAAVAPLIRPAGYFNVKARKLRSVAGHVVRAGGLAALRRRDPDQLRAELLGVYGIGPETADAILCYALGFPRFVADAYARRVGGRVGWLARDAGYEAARRAFEAGLRPRPPADPAPDALAAELGEFHALLVRLAKERCRRTDPECGRCPLRGGCALAQTGRLPGDAAGEAQAGKAEEGAQSRGAGAPGAEGAGGARARSPR
jgi:endonuclease-3 related protein